MVNYENTYWCEKGKYQEQYDSIEHLVPDRGESDDPAIELLRCMGNIYYDVYNNGGCNFDVLHKEIKHLNKFMLSQNVNIDWLGLDYKYDPNKVWEDEIETWWDEEEYEFQEHDDNEYFEFSQKTCDDLESVADAVILCVYDAMKKDGGRNDLFCD